METETTYKELSQQGSEAILELDERGTNALITDLERTQWNKKQDAVKVLDYVEDDPKNMTLLSVLHDEDDPEDAPNVVLRNGGSIYTLLTRGSKTSSNNYYDYVFGGPVTTDQRAIAYVIRYYPSTHTYDIYTRDRTNNTDITQNYYLPPTSGLVRRTLEAHTEDEDIHITSAERTLWNSAANTGKGAFYGVCYSDTSHSTKTVEVGSGFALKSGVLVTVFFQYGAVSVSGSARSLNVNSTGSYPIKYNGSSNLDVDAIPGQMRALFVFDGSAWQLLNPASINKTLFVLTFGTHFAGKTFTASGAGISSFSDVVPACLDTTIGMAEVGETLTISCDGYTKSFTITEKNGICHGYFNVLTENTWEEIAVASSLGMASRYWQVGDEKVLSLGSLGEVTLQIYDFQHDDLANGSGKAGITFGLKNLLGFSEYMEIEGTSVGSFVGSCLYEQLESKVWNALPSSLRPLIKPVKKKTSSGGGNQVIRTDNMSLFLFSQVECFGNTTLAAPGEGYRYPIFTDNSSRIKAMSDGTGPTVTWWTRSPAAASTTDYVYVDTAGGFGVAKADNALGICFGFCI